MKEMNSLPNSSPKRERGRPKKDKHVQVEEGRQGKEAETKKIAPNDHGESGNSDAPKNDSTAETSTISQTARQKISLPDGFAPIPPNYYLDAGKVKIDFAGEITEKHLAKARNYQEMFDSKDYTPKNPSNLEQGFFINPLASNVTQKTTKTRKSQKSLKQNDLHANVGQIKDNEKSVSVASLPVAKVTALAPTISPRVLTSLKSSVTDAHPTSLSQFVGQRSEVQKIEYAVKVAQKNGTAMEHTEIAGPPGVGKSIIVEAIAKDLQVPYRMTLGTVKKGELNNLLLNLKDREILHIDEAHGLGRSCVDILLAAVLNRRVFVTMNHQNVPLPLQDFTLVLSTTDTYSLDKALRSRMMLSLAFKPYSKAELSQIVEERCKKLRWDFDPDILPEIASRGQGIPRIALRLLQSVRRVSQAKDSDKIQMHHCTEAIEIEGIDSIGLDREQQECLRILRQGPARISTVAQRLNVKDLTVSKSIEPYLVEKGLIDKDKQGIRFITPLGIRHIGKVADSQKKGGVQ